MSRPTDAQIAAKIREEFPKCSRAAYSMAVRTNETGVMLCPRAREIRAEYLKQTRKKENRRFSFRVYGRIPDELAVRVLTKLKGGSVQDLLLMLLTEWVMKEDTDEQSA